MSREQLEAALTECRVHQMPLPEGFKWAGNGYRGGRTQVQLEADWPNMPLEQRIGLTACLFGRPVHSPESHKLVSDAYLALCHGRTLDEFCDALAKRAQPAAMSH